MANSNTYPEVSIVLPTYNRAAYIRGAIDSVLKQTYTNWELLVVDDGSTDNTVDCSIPQQDFGRRVQETSD